MIKMVRRGEDDEDDEDSEDDEDFEISSPQSADFVDVIHTNGGHKMISEISLRGLQVLTI